MTRYTYVFLDLVWLCVVGWEGGYEVGGYCDSLLLFFSFEIRPLNPFSGAGVESTVVT